MKTHSEGLPRPLLLVCALLAAASWPVLVAEVGAADSELSLRVEIDRHEFLPGEPIVIGLSIENRGAEAFDDLGTLNPRQEFVALRLMRDGTELPWSGRQETWFFSIEGTRLEAGARLCDVFDLLEYFGSRASISRGERVFSFRYLLAPGSYSLRARFRARMGIRKDLPQVIVEGNEVSFTVKDAAAIPDAEVGALDLLQDTSRRDSAHAPLDRWKDIRGRGLSRSRYLEPLARAYLPLADSVDVLALAAEYLSQGGGRLTAARILRSGCERFGTRLNASQAWLSKAAREDTKGSFTCFLRMWEEGITQARKYGRGED